jgi:hypothetical protein
MTCGAGPAGELPCKQIENPFAIKVQLIKMVFSEKFRLSCCKNNVYGLSGGTFQQNHVEFLKGLL